MYVVCGVLLVIEEKRMYLLFDELHGGALDSKICMGCRFSVTNEGAQLL